MPHHTSAYQGNEPSIGLAGPPASSPMPTIPEQPISPFVTSGPLLPGQRYYPQGITDMDQLNALKFKMQMRNYGKPRPPNFGLKPTSGYHTPSYGSFTDSLISTMFSVSGGAEIMPPSIVEQEVTREKLGEGFEWHMRHIAEPTAAAFTSVNAVYNEAAGGSNALTSTERYAENYKELPTWAKAYYQPPTVDFRGLAGPKKLEEFKAKKEQYEAEGLSRSQAETKAYQETEFNEGYKGAVEFTTDPAGLALELIPGGMLAKPAFKALGATGRGVGRGTELSRAAFNQNYKQGLLFRDTLRQGMQDIEPYMTDLQRAQFLQMDVPQTSPLYGYAPEGRGIVQTGSEIDPTGSARAIGQMFPEGAPYQQIGRAIEEADPDKMFQRFEAEAQRILNARSKNRQWNMDPPRLGPRGAQAPIPKYKGPTTLIFDESANATRRFEMPVVMQRLIQRTAIGESGALATRLEMAGVQAGELTVDEFSDVKTFIKHWGVNPYASSDEALKGKFRVNPTTGERHFVMGAFDNPFSRVKTDTGKMISDRNYLTYSPETKQWGITGTPEEIPALIDVQTGDNITDQIQKVINAADNELAKIDAMESITPNIGPQWKALQRQRTAINERKLHEVSRLEGRPAEPVFETVQPAKMTPEEAMEFNKMWKDLYEENLEAAILRGDPYNPYSIPNMGVKDFGFRPAKNGGRKHLNDTLIEEMASTRHPTVWDAYHFAIDRVAAERGLPKPPVPVGRASKALPPDDPPSALDLLIRPAPGADGMSADDAIAYWYGARNVADNELRGWWDDGNKMLGDLKVNGENLTKYKGRYIVPENVGKILMRALYDGDGLKGVAPEGFEDIWAHMKQLRDQEESAYIQFDPDMRDSFMMHPDYFPRIWKRLDENTGEYVDYADLDINEIPGHLRPRSNATFDEMVDMGYEPVSWNPVDIMALRRKLGVEHREQLIMIDRLKGSGVAQEVAIGSAVPDKYRVPKIGPAFEGYSVTNKYLASADVGQYAVPRQVADTLESIYGVRPKLSFARWEDVMPSIRLATSVPKRVLLSLSGFQHVDMLTRGWGAAFAPSNIDPFKKEGLWSGKTLKAIPFTTKLLASQVFGGDFLSLGRAATNRRSLDPTPMFDDFNISRKMIAEAGWNIQGDTSIISRGALDQLKDIERSIKPGAPKIVLDRIGGAFKWWESGLFEGVYRESQMFQLDNFIVPKLRKKFPNEDPLQIARRAADEVNRMSSSLGEWQTVFKSPAMKDISRAALFSPNETEAWLQMMGKSVKGDVKGLYGEYWAGYLTFLAAFGNSINLMTTGKPMDWEAYSPITIARDEDGDIPFSLRYNTRFMSPQIGTGREGQPIYLDLVGQADTPFMWIINWKDSLNSRLSPIASLARPFMFKETFFGEPLEGISQQSLHAGLQFLPIGANHALQLGREHGPMQNQLSSLMPAQETGLGTLGYGFQIGGLNVRKSTTKALLDELARIEGFDDVPAEWGPDRLGTLILQNPTPYEQLREQYGPGDVRRVFQDDDPRIQEIVKELELRQKTGVDRGNEYAQLNTAQIRKDMERMDQENALIDEIINKEIPLEGWFEHYQDIQSRTMAAKRGLEDFYTEEKGLDRKPPKGELSLARWQYYNAFEEARTDSARMAWDVLEFNLDELESQWTPEQLDHISDLREKDHSVYHDSEHANGWLVDVLNRRDKYAKPYYAITRNYFKEIGMYDTYKEYHTIGNEKLFMKENPEFAKHYKFMEEMRKEMRETNPELLTTLYLLGEVQENRYLELMYGQ